LALVYEPCRAVLNDVALLIADDMPINFQRDSRVRVPQLPLHDSRSCAVREQGTGRTMSQRVESAALNS
jgi:hypothetical protein